MLAFLSCAIREAKRVLSIPERNITLWLLCRLSVAGGLV